MNKFIKIQAITFAVLTLALAGITPANATSPTLNSTEFLASSGYLEFTAAAKSAAEYMATQSGQEITMVVSQPVAGVETTLSTMKISATKTKAKIELIEPQGGTSTMYFVDGALYTNTAVYKELFGPTNTNKVLSRMNLASTKMVKLTEVPYVYSDFQPSALFSTNSDVQTSILSSNFASSLALFTFSEVTKTTNAELGTTNYSYEMTMDLFGTTMSVNQSYTFNSSSVLSDAVVVMKTVSDAGETQVKIGITTEVKNDLVIDTSATSNLVNESAITKISNQIAAEDLSTAKAKALVKKATELAKKAKAKISGKHLADAAKALKYTVTKLSNGVKLTATYSGVKGSLCVTTTNGKVATKNC